MIDLWLVLSNGLWLAGLALLLAAVSWAWWAAGVDGVRFGAALARPPARWASALGVIGVCAGLAATGASWWERALWAALAVGELVHVVASRSRRLARDRAR
jgi:hypothetical protein